MQFARVLIIGVFALATVQATAAEVSPDLIAKAKQEGEVVYYTDLIVDQIVRPLASAFEAKYGIKVSYARADSQVNILKMLNEQKAGQVKSDIFGLNTGLEVLIAAGAAKQFTTANGEELPQRYRDPNHYWVSSHLFVITPAINTALVPAAQRPHSYEDLLAPFWKDKMVWKPNDLTGAPGFIGNILTSMGEARGMDYLRKLSRQNIKSVSASARAVLDQVIAREYAMSLQILNHHAAISADKGAPVDWVKLDPVTVAPGLVGMTKGAPHPSAGLLFIEFMTSPEGQKIFQAADYLPARPDVPPRFPDLIPETGGFTGNVITPAITAKGYEHWNQVYRELFQ
ncbi:MAG TPA: extracellular solute-binding protein [Xanthobacteraceae bacterium]|jgi:iron(III) transport system substrate-binding protein|nr:extracellular solute-binding protein [Xanthobacteraceae bacterium]